MDNTTHRLQNQWIRYGSVFGFLCFLAYFSRFMSIPYSASIWGTFLFGPLLALFSISLYHYMKSESDSVLNQSFVICNILAGVSVVNMFTVQNQNYWRHQKLLKEHSEIFSKDELWAVMDGVNSVQAGIGMVWDIFIFLGSIFLSVELLRRAGYFKKLIGLVGLILSASGLIMNFYAWPEVNPTSIGLYDLGPYIGMWYLFPYGLILYESIKNVRTFLSIEE